MQPDFDIQNREDLVRVLKKYQPRGGIPVKTLKESYPTVQIALEELEKEGRVLVTRSLGGRAFEDKEGAMKMAFYDDVGRPTVLDKGG